MTLDLIGYLLGGALLGALIGAVVAGVLKRRLTFWVSGGLVIGIAAGLTGLANRSGPERDAQLFYDTCAKALRGSAAESVDGVTRYCSCMAAKWETNEGGFRDAFDRLSAVVAESTAEEATAALISNEVVTGTVHTCLEPVVVDICVLAAGTQDDVDSYCRCTVDALAAGEGGLISAGEILASVADAQAFLRDPGVQQAAVSCD